MSEKIFSHSSFEKKGSFALFKAVKNEDMRIVKQLLEKNKYLVYDYDYVKKNLYFSYKGESSEFEYILVASNDFTLGSEERQCGTCKIGSAARCRSRRFGYGNGVCFQFELTNALF